MKKTLLLSVVASTMIMAGGTIDPVEPVVETPVASGWDFNGNMVAYYQTNDAKGSGDLGSGATSFGNTAIQLRANNKDIFNGIGFGAELSAIQGSENFSKNTIQTGAALTQAYLTYGMGNTVVKIGRQTLPKTLSPFAFTEGWQVVKNTFEAARIVNTDLSDTTLVYAAVTRSNGSFLANISSFNNINTNGDVVHMITAQNKSIDGLTLTGSYYMAPDFTTSDDLSALWADAKFKMGDYSVALQGGNVDAGTTDATAFGAKIAGNFGMFNASAAYSSVDDGGQSIHNLGTGVKTPLYTQAILNQGHIKKDADAIKIAASMKALGGKFGLAYITAKDNATSNSDYTELDVTYKTKLNASTTVFAAFVTHEDEAWADSQNFVRVWARYNFN